MDKIRILNRQALTMHGRLSQLYRSASASATPTDLLPAALKELGVASEELHVMMEELTEQNDQLINAQRQADARQLRYQNLFESSPDCYLITDAVGVIEEANRAAVKLLNFPQQFLIGKPLANLIDVEQRSLFRSKLSQLAHQDRLEMLVSVQRRHDEQFNAVLTADVLRDQDGQFLGLRWVLCDNTDRKRAQATAESPDYNPCYDRPLRCYSKGDLIPLNPRTFWLVADGVVKLTTLSNSGEEMLIGLAGESKVFGSDLTALPVYQAIALTDVHLLSIAATEISHSPRLAQTLLPLFNQRLQQTESFLAIYGQLRVEDRLKGFLQLLKQEIGSPVEDGVRLQARLTHQDFASACCTTRVTMTRLLSKLQQEGTISLDRERHLVLHSV